MASLAPPAPLALLLAEPLVSFERLIVVERKTHALFLWPLVPFFPLFLMTEDYFMQFMGCFLSLQPERVRYWFKCWL